MLCQWCHPVLRSTMQILRQQAVRWQSFHTCTCTGPVGASFAFTDLVQQKPGSPRLRYCAAARRPDAGYKRAWCSVATGPQMLTVMPKHSEKAGVCGRRWMSSDGNGGRGDLDGTPPAGHYRSPWTILKEEFKVLTNLVFLLTETQKVLSILTYTSYSNTEGT